MHCGSNFFLKHISGGLVVHPELESSSIPRNWYTYNWDSSDNGGTPLGFWKSQGVESVLH